MKRPVTEYERDLLLQFPGSDYGRVFLGILQEELKEDELSFDLTAKICDDPISEDWRFKRGGIAKLRHILDIPRKYTNNLQIKGGQ